MRIPARKTLAVLTGDVVRSTSLPPAKRRGLDSLLRGIGASLEKYHADAVPIPIGIFRGDSWQLLVTRPELSLRVALELRAALKVGLGTNGDCRIGIGIGEIDFIPGDSVSAGEGPAYAAAGQALDQLKRGELMAVRFGFPPRSTPETRLVQALVHATDALAQGWTTGQAQAILGALRRSTQATIAAGWKPTRVSQQAVTQFLARGHWTVISNLLEAIESSPFTDAPGLPKRDRTASNRPSASRKKVHPRSSASGHSVVKVAPS